MINSIPDHLSYPGYIAVLLVVFLFSGCLSSVSPGGNRNTDVVLQPEMPPGSSGAQQDTEQEAIEPQVAGYRISSLEEFYPGVSELIGPYSPLTRNSRIQGWILDLNGDGNDDAVFVCVHKDALTASFYELSREIRLYDDSYDASDFSVVIFLSAGRNTAGEMVFTRKAVSLGSYRMIKSYTYKNMGEVFPFTVEIALMNENTITKHLVFCGEDVSHISLVDSPRRTSRITDIDDDGIVDIIISERFFEEASGEETFLSWYKWNGKRFVEYSTTNIVRNLNSFLYQVSRLIESRYWNRFFRFALDSTFQSELSGFSPDRLLESLFLPADGKGMISVANIRFVRFHEILENPFSLGNSRVMIPCKITATNDHFFNVEIELAGNPFIQPQFSLVPRSGPRALQRQ